MFDWQTIAVALAILAAAIYLARLGWLRLRSFRAAKGAGPCETGCGSCEESRKPTTAKRTVFVEISGSGTSTKNQRR